MIMLIMLQLNMCPHRNLCCIIFLFREKRGGRGEGERTPRKASAASSNMRRCMIVGGLKLPHATRSTGQYASPLQNSTTLLCSAQVLPHN